MQRDLLELAQLLAQAGEEFLLLDSAGHLHPERDQASWLFFGEVLERYQGSLHQPAELDQLRQALQALPASAPPLAGTMSYEGEFCFTRFGQLLKQGTQSGAKATLTAAQAKFFESLPQPAPSVVEATASVAASKLPALRADSSDRAYLHAIERALEYIAAGDIYQVNLARRWSMPWPPAASLADAWRLYQAWRAQTRAPQSAFARLGSQTLLSASPETFLQLSADGQMSTHPIKGTIRASADPRQDAQLKSSLQNSSKERAELLMITDLLRNDLGQVAQTGTVKVSALHQLESFGHLHHLVSSVEAKLGAEFDVLELLRAMHPGGSITGAPKQRAREIIAELEAHERGLYCGHIGWLGKESCRFSVAIRSAVIEAGQLRYHAGSGIVADSQPEEELAETQLKASAFAQSLQKGY